MEPVTHPHSRFRRPCQLGALLDFFLTRFVICLKHTYGRRLRAAGVPVETRKVFLGHRNGDVTTHYSAPELRELIEAANRVCRKKSGTGGIEDEGGQRVTRLSSCFHDCYLVGRAGIDPDQKSTNNQ
jgi:hypothetical protein